MTNLKQDILLNVHLGIDEVCLLNMTWFVLQTKCVSSGEDLVEFLVDFVRWDPSHELRDERAELMRNLMVSCKKQLIRSEIAAGSKVDQAVNAIWAAMIYHTPALHTSLRNFGKRFGQDLKSFRVIYVGL